MFFLGPIQIKLVFSCIDKISWNIFIFINTISFIVQPREYQYNLVLD